MLKKQTQGVKSQESQSRGPCLTSVVFTSPFPAAETEARIRDARGGGNLVIAEDNDSLGKETREEEGEGLCEKGRKR